MAGERFGDYELLSLIGRGGMGEVYRAVDTRKRRGVVALKRLPASRADDEAFRRRFLREAELTARLRDPHVIPIHDYGVIDDQPYLEMRLVDGADLADRLSGGVPLPVRSAVDVVEQIAGALDAAHQEGLVHRDVKPSNVLLSRSATQPPDAADFVYLIDFGLAASLFSTRRASSAYAGTVAYMAPERFGTGGDHRVDVYALGCLLYETLVGRAPFGGDPAQTIAAHLQSPPPRPSDRGPDVPDGFDAVVARAMAKDPEERHPTAGALARAARQAVPTLPAPDRPAPAPTDGPSVTGGPDGGPVIIGGPGPPAPGARGPILPRVTVTTAWPSAPGNGRADVPAPDGATTATPFRPAPPAPARKRSVQVGCVVTVAAAALVAVAVPVVLTVNEQAGGPSAAAPAAPQGVPPARTAPVDDGFALISSYYDLLPADPDTAFDLLGPEPQAASGGRQNYDAFYASLRDVSVENLRRSPDGSFTATVVFTKRDGSVASERYRFTVGTAGPGGKLVITGFGRI